MERTVLATICGSTMLLLLGGVAGAGADLPICYTPPPDLEATATLIRDPGLDVSPGSVCPSCANGCTGPGACYDCWDTDSVGGVDFCCYHYQGDTAYESCGVTLDWYADAGEFNDGAFPYLDLRVATPTGGSARVTCQETGDACTAGSSESHCTAMQFTFDPSVITGWEQKAFSLYGVTDCTSAEPFRKRLVAEHRERFLSPQGSITASPNPCIHDQEEMGTGDPYCTTSLTYEATELDQPNVVIYVRDNGTTPEWSEPIPMICQAAGSTPTTISPTGVLIKDEDGITFELWETASCGPPYPSYPSSGSPLDTVVVTSEPEGTVVCGLDGEPMRQGVEIGVNSNGIDFSCSQSPDPAECYADLAAKLAAIGVEYHRIAIQWSRLYPGADCEDPPPSTLDFTHYDTILEAFSDAGIEPWLILNSSPCWYSSIPDPFPSGCNQHPYQVYPPDPADTAAWSAWLGYIEAVYDRYGPGENGILDVPARNFEAWNEPVGFLMAIDPVSCTPGNPEGENADLGARYEVWEELQRSLWDVVTASEGEPPTDSTVWSANIVYTELSTEEVYGSTWIDPQIGTIGVDDMFDGFNLHAFQRDYTHSADPSRESGIESVVQQVRSSRARLDAAGATSMPIAITETSWHARADWDPWQFLRELPDGDHRAQFLKDSFACLANAGGDKILWFNATDYGYECGSQDATACADVADDPDCVSWGVALLTVDDDEVVETPLYCAFADLCRHLDGCTVTTGVCE